MSVEHHTWFDLLIQGWDRACREAVLPMLDAGEQAAMPAPARDGLSSNHMYYATLAFNVSFRAAGVAPRRVLFAPELFDDPGYRSHKNRLHRVAELLQEGSPELDDPKSTFRSRTLETVLARRFEKNRPSRFRLDRKGRPRPFLDFMLYDWGIHHFHLKQGRGDGLLFAYLSKTEAFMLGVGTHLDFENPEYVRRLDAHWPGIVPTLSGVTPSNLSVQERRNVRRNHVLATVPINGKCAAPVVGVSFGGVPGPVVNQQVIIGRQLKAVADGWMEAVGAPPPSAEVHMVAELLDHHLKPVINGKISCATEEDAQLVRTLAHHTLDQSTGATP